MFFLEAIVDTLAEFGIDSFSGTQIRELWGETGQRDGLRSSQPDAPPLVLALLPLPGMHVAAGSNWEVFMTKLYGRFAKCKLLVPSFSATEV